MSLLRTTARSLLSGVFIFGGVDAVIHPGSRVQLVRDAGWPAPEWVTRANGVVMTAGAAALALGFKPQVSAVALVGSLIPTTLVGHPVWRRGPGERKIAWENIVKNGSLIGGLLYATVEEPADS